MPSSVKVETSARLHLGFLDLNGASGRKFGSLGLALDRPVTRLRIRHSDKSLVEGPERDRVAGHLRALQDHLGLTGPYHVTIEDAIPAHVGLGSGTQVALALAAALRRLESLPVDMESDALLLRRGARSGIGAALFSRGGVVVDGGHGGQKTVPPIICHLPFPEEWRIILVIDHEITGVHGDAEREAFVKLPIFPEMEAARICHAVLMKALPALAERDLVAFGEAITSIQTSLGDYFAPAQGGARYTSPKVAAVMATLAHHGAKGIGQSSWGPTGFAFAESDDEAQRLVNRVRENSAQGNPVMLICKGINHGARIDMIQGPQVEG
ncbi:beta-ribofuranosylaminobenzene 5'-phosphate synthase family protein [Methylovirgula sp. HY1]|uniref:beta-ribofuranosylaminobenzene 5'-phosphate synthase family protein n=1 Tax=Methylovirgula sp. HY1 TaxID=2822761 RepID=UPI001C5AA0C5|nr:beta-ribofuranosylaminobenzene 5'-phosphate synthase family protein [Methylovirgula sp. HY1]QXX75368.1 Homoserine kinase [Methylovirgula sp. HY1]